MLNTEELLPKKDSRTLEYPRPQFKREHWYDLNGQWEFQFDDENKGERTKWFQGEMLEGSIEVPYAYQSEKSGIHSNEHHSIVWYERSFDWDLTDQEVLLHFEAVDYHTKVWLNGEWVGEHEGGHTPFSFCLASALKDGRNTLTVRVEDTNSVEQPIGKQSWKEDNFLCWYTRTTGIWQPVWLEEVHPYNIEDVKMTPKIEEASIVVDASLTSHENPLFLEADVYFKGEWVATAGSWVKPGKQAELTIRVDSDCADFRLHYWSPDTPHLYDIRFTLKDHHGLYDVVDSYFGMRDIEVQEGRILLNRETFYQKLVLDQGYYPESLMTADAGTMEADLRKVKEMGFNGVRRHQTIADRRYMYLCDKLGLVMWAEMPSFFHFTTRSMQRMFSETREMIEKHYNHPSVITYTLMNESWGVNEIFHRTDQQNFVNALYYQTKAFDPTRLVVGNDGWEHTLTDVLTVHDYTSDPSAMKKSYENKETFVDGSPSCTSRKQNYAKGYRYQGEPVMVSEYGGIAYGSSSQGDWGYGSRPENAEEVVKRLEDITSVILENDYIQGFCYTQLTDVEQEVNGLLDENHEYKFDPEKIRSILAKHTSGFVFE